MPNELKLVDTASNVSKVLSLYGRLESIMLLNLPLCFLELPAKLAYYARFYASPIPIMLQILNKITIHSNRLRQLLNKLQN